MGGLRIGLPVAALVLGLDQLTKALALATLAGEPPIRVTDFFNLVLVWNPGVSFGLLQGLGGRGPWLLAAFGLAVCIVLLVWLRRETRKLTGTALGLVLGGALGNIVDRARFGAVVDFLDFHAMGYHWPAFNISDSAIVVGALLLLLDGLRSDRTAAGQMRGQTR
jgi:signal peptidase II